MSENVRGCNSVRHGVRAISKIRHWRFAAQVVILCRLPRKKKQTSEQMLQAQQVRGFKHLQRVLSLLDRLHGCGTQRDKCGTIEPCFLINTRRWCCCTVFPRP